MPGQHLGGRPDGVSARQLPRSGRRRLTLGPVQSCRGDPAVSPPQVMLDMRGLSKRYGERCA